MYLTANFIVNLSGNCLVTWPDDGNYCFETKINEFSVKACFVRDRPEEKLAEDEHWTYILHQIKVSVSKEEQEDPPKVLPNNNGELDYSRQLEYFDQRLEAYSKAAQETTNRIIKFFKYQLYTPFLKGMPSTHHCFLNAKWTDIAGKEVGKGTMTFVAIGALGLHGQFGVSKLTKDCAANLQIALEKTHDPNLYEELFSDAQSAFFEGNTRRGVLELAIGCEILVKRSFFFQDTPAGAAFDYFEDKSLVRIRVIDLIDHVAKEAFKKSFREDNPNHHKNIDYLFRCRNKIAHKGALSFRDDSGNYIKVDENIVADWWTSISVLNQWLNECQNK